MNLVCPVATRSTGPLPVPEYSTGTQLTLDFDLGKEVTGGTTPYDQKDARDTWYSMQRVKALNGGIIDKGSVLLSSDAVGTNLKGYNSWSKPEFARQPVIRDNFFRSTGVLRSVY